MSQRFLFTKLAVIVAFVTLGQAAAQADLLTGLKSYYNFNESTGTSLPLSAGSGNAGVLNNMTNADWVASQPGFGNALDFDGIDDYVRIPNGYTNTVSGDNTHTIAMWLYPRSLAVNPVILDSEDGGYYDYFLELSPSTPGYTSVGGSYRSYTGTPLSLNTWHQLVFTKTGAGNSGELYFDGVLQATYTGGFGSTVTSTSDFLLSRFKNAGFEFNGLVDDLAFWDRDLSETEIATLYNQGFELDVIVHPAPEPSTLLLFALGGLGLVRHTRKRKQQG
jgi:hypothetical protein